MSHFGKAVANNSLRERYGLDSPDDYDRKVGLRSMLLDVLMEAGIVVPTASLESSDAVTKYLIETVTDPDHALSNVSE